MPVSVMRLTNINKGIIKLLPQIDAHHINNRYPTAGEINLARGIPCES